MAIMDTNADPDVLRVWTLLSEVSEQLSQNRSSAVNLHALADGAKVGTLYLWWSIRRKCSNETR